MRHQQRGAEAGEAGDLILDRGNRGDRLFGAASVADEAGQGVECGGGAAKAAEQKR
jgi:hypothetical protein